MKKIVVVLALVAFAGSAFAAAPDSVVLKNVKGDITFGHAKHTAGGQLKDCKACHADVAGGKIGALGKDKGHSVCLDCHKKSGNDKAPTKCGDCHKK
ncbi:MAG: cytochrome c3 family protein [Deltaproteobacteria bacterium]